MSIESEYLRNIEMKQDIIMELSSEVMSLRKEMSFLLKLVPPTAVYIGAQEGVNGEQFALYNLFNVDGFPNGDTVGENTVNDILDKEEITVKLSV